MGFELFEKREAKRAPREDCEQRMQIASSRKKSRKKAPTNYTAADSGVSK